MSMPESVNGSGDVNQESRGNKSHERCNRLSRRVAAARKHPETDLNHIDHRQHQEETAHNRSDSGSHHSPSQNLDVDMSSENLVNVFAVEKVQGKLETLSYEGREEEEAEGDDFEDH